MSVTQLLVMFPEVVVSGDLLSQYPLCLLLVFWFLCIFNYFLSYFEKLCVSSGALLVFLFTYVWTVCSLAGCVS